MYKSNGTNFGDGLRLGNYTSSEIFQPSGVGSSAVMAQSFKITAKPPTELITEFPLNDNSTTQITLGSVANNYAEAGAEIVDINGTMALKLDVSRRLVFESNDVPGIVNIHISGFDDYNQKLTNITEVSEGVLASEEMSRGIRYVTNIYVTSGGSDKKLSISTSKFLELPFTDYGVIGSLITDQSSGTLIGKRVGDAPPYRVSPAYIYEHAWWESPLTLISGRVRPVFSPKEFTEEMTFNIFQPVYGYGYLPDMPSGLAANPFKDFTSNEIDLNTNNNLTLAIGIEQYSEGWKPWAG
jgi:hypothetical protein